MAGGAMSSRERFRAICRFERTDDPWVLSVASWNETLDRWVAEGMPVSDLSNMRQTEDLLLGPHDRYAGISPVGAIFGMGKCNNPPWIVALDPLFERKTLEDDGTHIVYQDWDGTVVRRARAHDDAIPQYLSFPVRDPATWKEFKKRLDPHSPGRWRKGWEIMGQDKGIGYTRAEPPLWTRWLPVRVRAMVKAGDVLFAAGPPDVFNADDPYAAFEGRAGGRLVAVAGADGKPLAERTLESPPVFDGLIAAGGRLYLADEAGAVRCFGAK